MPDPILSDLKQVSDETLYRRLVLLRQRFPEPLPEEDYVFRCDLWEMANKAVRAEIRRRAATPPPWWPRREEPAPPARRPLLGPAVMCLATIVGATILFGPLALAVAVTVTAAGARIWWAARQAAPKERAATPPPRSGPAPRSGP